MLAEIRSRVALPPRDHRRRRSDRVRAGLAPLAEDTAGALAVPCTGRLARPGAQRRPGGHRARHRPGGREGGRRRVPPRPHLARVGAEHERVGGADGARHPHAARRGALPRAQRRPDLLALQAVRRPLPGRVVLPGAVGRDRLPDALARRPARTSTELPPVGVLFGLGAAVTWGCRRLRRGHRRPPGRLGQRRAGLPRRRHGAPRRARSRVGVAGGRHGGRPAVLRAGGGDRVGLVRLLLPRARDRADLRPQPDRVRLRHGHPAARDHPARRAARDGRGRRRDRLRLRDRARVVRAAPDLHDRARRCPRAPVRARGDGAARRLRARRLGQGRRARLARAGLPRPALLHVLHRVDDDPRGSLAALGRLAARARSRRPARPARHRAATSRSTWAPSTPTPRSSRPRRRPTP